ncbi:glycosyltransferase family 4 protein [Flavobacterium cerinum]|uniref:Glycosyltransferase family 4 protein n=1 Tax=Flavobacterium cerinum TaxID=2502784 RepID=A0ABY5IW66_9FLAO|nr:glycosyltransferase family 4 protein [Flavobacterium cerinum]UUC47050.1 glycosyltransferase family 4 protein [Flavobacterium cerinum]
MRIVQLIDSLEPGGAEKMAVTYANVLASEVSFSALITTRKEGALKKELDSDVSYLFANRKSVFDARSIWQVRKYLKKNRVSIIQAHSSSFFFALLLKITKPSLKIVWHDHYGFSDFVSERKNKKAIQLASLFFFRIITVNDKLKVWAEKNLYCKAIKYLPNFVSVTNNDDGIRLKGAEGKRILCLANLREQKNHLLLLKVAKKIKEIYPDWTFHLVGKDFGDTYSATLRERISVLELENTVFLYGSTDNSGYVIKQSQIGVLTSVSEGLPVSLLEYGYFSLPVVTTAVGEIPSIIKETNGILVPEGNTELFSEGLLKLIADSDYRQKIGSAFKNDIEQHYTKESVLKDYLNFINNGN